MQINYKIILLTGVIFLVTIILLILYSNIGSNPSDNIGISIKYGTSGIRGIIVDNHGSPIPNCRVVADTTSGDVGTRTDANGYFVIKHADNTEKLFVYLQDTPIECYYTHHLLAGIIGNPSIVVIVIDIQKDFSNVQEKQLD